MKMTLIDCAIVFAVANVMLAGIATKAPPPDLYMDPPICNPDQTAPPSPTDDPRCASLRAVPTPAPASTTSPIANSTAPAQIPQK